uniref:Transmembrane protein n=1 Tax=Heterorhabditis bacteriophora TaxID=37862 RepID=A0A1I7WH97_HETBA
MSLLRKWQLRIPVVVETKEQRKERIREEHQKAKNIGVWLSILDVLSKASVTINVGHIILRFSFTFIKINKQGFRRKKQKLWQTVTVKKLLSNLGHSLMIKWVMNNIIRVLHYKLLVDELTSILTIQIPSADYGMHPARLSMNTVSIDSFETATQVVNESLTFSFKLLCCYFSISIFCYLLNNFMRNTSHVLKDATL